MKILFREKGRPLNKLQPPSIKKWCSEVANQLQPTDIKSNVSSEGDLEPNDDDDSEESSDDNDKNED
jgi:hypothetical protein